MSQVLTEPASVQQTEEDDPPFYGWRYVQRTGPNGETRIEQQLLTLEDTLHPQEEDDIAQNSAHFIDECYLGDVCRSRDGRLENGLVLGDCLIDWGVPGLRNHCADISIFGGLKVVPPEGITTFRLRPSGGHCLAVIEIVSPAWPDTRDNDVVRKKEEYHEAGVPLYIIVDQKKAGGPREVLAYRHTPAGFVSEPVDSRGRALIRVLGIRIGLKDNHVRCWDADTDAELGDYVSMERELAASRQALAQERQAAEEDAKTQAQALAAAEEDAQKQAQARAAAEQDAQKQAQARAAAEEDAQKQAQARAAAEEDAQKQAQARAAAEARIRELEEQLRSRN